MTAPCPTHPTSRRGYNGRCLGCHNARSDEHRRRRVNSGLPAQIPMTDAQRDRKRAVDRDRYARNREAEKARQRDLHHTKAFERELAAMTGRASVVDPEDYSHPMADVRTGP